MDAAPKSLRVLIFVALALQILSETALNTVDIDLWHEMALAREIVATGTVPRADPFAYTPTLTEFIHHEWGAGMVAYAVAAYLDGIGILLLKYGLLAAVVALVLRCALHRGGDIGQWGPMAVPALLLVAGGFLPVRAQMYSYLFVAALLLFLQRDEEGARWWIAPWLLAFPFWVNLHGGCALGIVLVVLSAVERLLRREPFAHLLTVAGGMLVLLAANPYGTRYYAYLWRALTMARPQITEWRPVWTFPLLVVIAFGVSVAVLLYAAIAGRLRATPGISLLLALALQGALHAKLAPLFGLAWLCYVPGYLAKTRMGRSIMQFHREWIGLAFGLWLLVAFLCAYSFVSPDRNWKLRVPGDAMSGPVYPVGAVEFLKARRFRGNLMTSYSMGGYVMWKLYPAVRISLDSRFEVAYPTSLLDEAMQFYAARPGWERVLTKYPTDAVLVSTAAPLAVEMPRAGWSRRYSDRRYEIYVRPGLDMAPMDRSGPVPDGTIP
jgi:hypothetical protein